MKGGKYIDRRPPKDPKEVPEYLAYLVDQLNFIFNYYSKLIATQSEEEDGNG